MKIALLGNINNANFSLLRNLRDNGIDATLLLWKNDGKLSHSHFKLSDDTWNINYWSKFVKRTNISNASSSLIYNPLKPKNYILEKYFLNLYYKYDIFIGSGIAPAIFEKFNKKLDIFYPYAMGIEWVNTIEDKVLNHFDYRKIILSKIKKLQVNGLKNTQFVINPELGITEDAFKKIKVKTHQLYVPLVYKEKKQALNLDIKKKIKKFDFKIISHCRHVWKSSKSLSALKNMSNSKNNDWLILAFKTFLKETKSNSCLILFKYGPDFEKSMELCKKIGIEDNVIWFPIMKRKKILQIIEICDVGAGEFYQKKKTFWGGTALEIMSQGKVTLQTFKFSKKEFSKIFHKPIPPLIKINSKLDIKRQIKKIYLNKSYKKNIELKTKKWFSVEYKSKLILDWIKIIKLAYRCQNNLH